MAFPGSRSLVTFLATLTVGCAAAYEVLPSIDPRSPREQEEARMGKCEGTSTQKWDLGTGSLEDIAVREPDFYSFGPEGSHGNRKRVWQLEQAELPDGLDLAYRTVSGHRLLQLLTPVSNGSRIFMFPDAGGGSRLMLVPDQCPHVFVEEACADDRLTTQVTTDGTLPCFMGISGPLTVNGNGIPNNSDSKAGETIPLSAVEGTFVTVDWRTERVFSGPVSADDFHNPTPEMLIAVVEHSDDSTAFTLFNQMDPELRSAELRAQVEELRIASIQDQLASRDILVVLQTTAFDDTFPGSSQIRQLVDEKLTSEMRRLVSAPSTGPDFWRGVSMIDRTINRADLPLEAFVEKYGKFIGEQDFRNESQNVREAADEFVRRWPKSPWATRIAKERQEAADAARAKAEAARREQETAERREAAEERSRCAARCEHKCMAGIYADKALCRRGCVNYECDGNFCEGACQVDCSRANKSGQPGCVAACQRGRCGN